MEWKRNLGTWRLLRRASWQVWNRPSKGIEVKKWNAVARWEWASISQHWTKLEHMKGKGRNRQSGDGGYTTMEWKRKVVLWRLLRRKS